MHLNLRPFMFRAPLLMQQGASLTRALSLFRHMGLHHILVAPPDPRAIGFITRKVIPLSFQSLDDINLQMLGCQFPKYGGVEVMHRVGFSQIHLVI